MGIHFWAFIRYVLIFIKNNIKLFFVSIIQVCILFWELLAVGEKFMRIVNHELKIHPQMAMVVLEIIASMFTASCMIGDQLVMNAFGSHTILSIRICGYWVIISFCTLCVCWDDSEHFEAPKILFPFSWTKSLNIFSYSNIGHLENILLYCSKHAYQLKSLF